MKYLTILFLLFATSISAQTTWLQSILDWQAEMNREFADTADSPLDEADLQHFEGLDFFAPDSAYCVQATMILVKDSKAFPMKTTTDRAPMYRIYGYLHFKINGKAQKLAAYQRIEFSTSDDYADYLFIPFTDLTNGNETYYGGRYMDIQINPSGMYTLDFNMAYNPYCAYSDRWSCPLVPEENALDCKIEAGVKKFH
ncbi:MAG: hypothetical protein C0592_03045 [Marinilabiliales bacterium]|nr:MAG: hypothetical protein C0592_03045 [Marinilabiliales bacterium]